MNCIYSEKTVSVIVPIYNSSQFLEKCITSIINQTYKNLEIILVDDGSTDDSYTLCQYFQSIDKRIVLLHQKNSGQSVARNNALNIASGSFIMFVDSDDWIDSETIERMLYTLCSKSLDAVKCAMTFIGQETCSNQSLSKYKELNSDEIYKYILADEIGGHLCGWLYKADLWQNIRLPKGRLAEDAAVLPKVLLGKNFCVIPDAFYKYNCSNPFNSSNSKENGLKNAVDRAIMFFERAQWLENINYTDNDVNSLLIKKAVSFSVGSIRIYKNFHYDSKDIEYIVSFFKKYKKQILISKNIDIFRKICVIMILLFSPNKFFFF